MARRWPRPALRSSQPFHPLSPARLGCARRSPSSCLNVGEGDRLMLMFTKPHDEAQPDFLALAAHELADLLPMIDGVNFENLKGDIAKNGILEPILLFEGRILDGRNRYRAAKAVGHDFT